MDAADTYRGKRSAILGAAVVFALLLPLIFAVFFPRPAGKYPEFGEVDFIEYWSAYQLYTGREDPYDPSRVFAVEQAAGMKGDVALMMWNPPWLLTLFSPILGLDFDSAARSFLGLNIGLLLLALVLTLDALQVPLRKWGLCMCVGCCSVPVFLALQLGQMGLVLAFGVAGVLWSFAGSRPMLAGAFASILTIKPHVAYLLCIPLLIGLPMRVLARSICGFTLAMAVLFAAMSFQSPGSFVYWMNRGMHAGNPLLVDVYKWKTTTLASQIRWAMEYVTGVAPVWPLFAVPLVTIFTVTFLMWRRRASIDVRHVLPGLLPLSCCTAPFGWIFDCAVTCVTQAALCAWALESGLTARERRVVLYGIVGLSVVLLFHYGVLLSPYDKYWYVMPVLFGLWCWTRCR
jgi:hypothetical protein